MKAPLLEVRGLTKRFGGVTALTDVDFTLRAGEVHAICGENGAGKSTLIKILGGVHAARTYEGELLVSGAPAQFLGTRDAEAAGIAVIHQELQLVSEMSVAENLLLGHLPTRFGLIDWDASHAQARAILAEANIELDPCMRVSELGVGQRQLCEIAKAVGKKPRMLILDEPTAALAEHEIQTLLALVLRLAKSGVSCVYISHKLDEVLAVADRVTVLRDGRTVSTNAAGELGPADIIRAMVGRTLGELFPGPAANVGPVLLRVKDLQVARVKNGPAFLRDIQFDVRAGEVLGIGGLMGAGRSELLLHLFGAWGQRLGGAVALEGRALSEKLPHQVLAEGLCLVSEDRKRYGLVLGESIGKQLTLSSLGRFSRWGLLDGERLQRAGQELIETLRIKTTDLETVVGTLSGGNQQKVVLGKALLTRPKVLLLDEPTRGIDVGAKAEIYELIRRLTSEGMAVVLVSSELPELLGMSCRVVMLCEGRQNGIFSREEATSELLLAAAMGHSPGNERPNESSARAPRTND